VPGPAAEINERPQIFQPRQDYSVRLLVCRPHFRGKIKNPYSPWECCGCKSIGSGDAAAIFPFRLIIQNTSGSFAGDRTFHSSGMYIKWLIIAQLDLYSLTWRSHLRQDELICPRFKRCPRQK
jgi:hypothetical protein